MRSLNPELALSLLLSFYSTLSPPHISTHTLTCPPPTSQDESGGLYCGACLPIVRPKPVADGAGGERQENGGKESGEGAGAAVGAAFIAGDGQPLSYEAGAAPPEVRVEMS
jgi:hypothetical protein